MGASSSAYAASDDVGYEITSRLDQKSMTYEVIQGVPVVLMFSLPTDPKMPRYQMLKTATKKIEKGTDDENLQKSLEHLGSI